MLHVHDFRLLSIDHDRGTAVRAELVYPLYNWLWNSSFPQSMREDVLVDSVVCSFDVEAYHGEDFLLFPCIKDLFRNQLDSFDGRPLLSRSKVNLWQNTMSLVHVR